ncbi:MAG: HepT-like ribonuclease domain-containing protein [Chloroflexota bacterium]
MRDDRAYLTYLQESILLVQQYASDGQKAFATDLRTQDAVLRRMETLADAASHLSGELKERHPEIVWRQLSDFRNVLAHGYFEIRMDQIWQTVMTDLPTLKAVVDDELARES